MSKNGLTIPSDRLPTPDAINALPEPLRQYIHDLETNVAPADLIRQNIILKAERDALVVKLAELREDDRRD